MNKKPRWHELVCRAMNFHGSYETDYLEQSIKIEDTLRETEKAFREIDDYIFKLRPPTPLERKEACLELEKYLSDKEKSLLSLLPPISHEMDGFLLELQGVSEWIATDIGSLPQLNEKQILKMVFTRTYDLVFFKFFGRESIHDDAVFDACFFTSLCMFLHHSTHISGKSIRKFIYNNSPFCYDIKDSMYYFELDEYNARGKDMFEYEKFRKDKERILKNRDVNIKRPQGATIPADTEHEWRLFWILDDLDNDSQDTYKRIRNLYKDVLKDPGSPKDKGYKDRLEEVHKRFLNKLKQIKYDKFLKLQQTILEHIYEDERYRGMNIYRFERQLRLYNITYEVNRLLECKNEAEESWILTKSVLLNGIRFPKVYQDFNDIDDPVQIAVCAKRFTQFMDSVVNSCLLLLDDFIDKKYLGDDWETLFLDTINEMTDKVFYRPDEINFTVKPESQEKFMKILSAPVHRIISKFK